MFKRIVIAAASAAAIVTGLALAGATTASSATAGATHSNWIVNPGW